MVRIKSNWVQPNFEADKTDSRRNWGLLLLRVGVASLMLFGHGFDKLVNFTDKAANFPDPIGIGPAGSLALAVFAEFFCSVAIGFGFATRLATIPLIVTMLTAAFVIHGNDPWGDKELAMLYLVPYFSLLFTGAGKYSIDWLWLRKKKNA